jgi:abortive infection bacteriophage resistance protein
LVLDAVERIEVAVRSRLAHLHAQKHGPFGYALDPSALPSFNWSRWVDFCASVKRETERSKDGFVLHFEAKYGDHHGCLPVWAMVELMSFGSMLSFQRGCHSEIRRDLVKPFGVHDTVFDSWLLTLNTVRNICAHHGRLWNREIGTAPMIPRKTKHPEWHTPSPFPANRLFSVLTLCKWCVDRVAPQSGWAARLRNLLDEFPMIPRLDMGFPEGWSQSPIWLHRPESDVG